MDKDNVTNRKELIVYLLEELNKKNKPVRLDEFFFETGYAKGLESFQEVLEEMTKKGLINTIEERGGLALGILPTISLKYSISLNGIEYLQNLKPKSIKTRMFVFLKSNIKEVVVGIIVTVVGGIFLHFALNTKSIDLSIPNSTESIKPYFKIENYKIPPHNEELFSLDKIKIIAEYQGSDFTLEPEVNLIDFTFTDDYYFNDEIPPNLEILETTIENPRVNKLNKTGVFNVQLKRKVIFDGLKVYDFKTSDKTQVGTIRFEVNYKLNNTKYSDTLTSKIFVEK